LRLTVSAAASDFVFLRILRSKARPRKSWHSSQQLKADLVAVAVETVAATGVVGAVAVADAVETAVVAVVTQTAAEN
jgi:hypothetical protein